MKAVLAVAAGSAIGGTLRFLVSSGLLAWFPVRLPLGTLTVNVVGCFFMSLIGTLVASGTPLSAETRAFLMSGILGGFTTYSAFNFEALTLPRMLSIGYVLLMVALCLASGLLGAATGRMLAR